MDQSIAYELRCTSTRVYVRYLTPHAIRITHTQIGQRELPPERPWADEVLLPQPPVDKEKAFLVPFIDSGRLLLTDRYGKFEFMEFGQTQIAESGQAHFEVQILPGEILYGWGEWFNAFARNVGKIELKAQESAAQAQQHQTYSTIPLYFSNRGYAFFLLNSHTSQFDIQPQNGILNIETDGPPADYVLITGANFKEIISTYTQITGRPPLLPRWAFGLWMTSYPQENQDRVLDIANRHRERQVPLDVIVLDYHWEEKFHNFQWRKKLFPDPSLMIEELLKMNVRLGLIFTPFANKDSQLIRKTALNLVAHNISLGAERDDEIAIDEYDIAEEAGYLAHSNVEWWFGKGGMIDFTNPAACTWWNNLLAPLYRMGVYFFKNDDGEYLPMDAVSAMGMDGKEYHNIYGFFYGKAIYEGLKSFEPSRRPMVYSRSVWAGSQRFPAMFLGDQKPTFAHMKSTIRAGLNMSLAGFAYWTADIFGLDGKNTPETHMRYAQWALFTPIARYFTRPPVIDDTRNPWSFSPEVEGNFKRHVELRYRLLPYYCRLAWEAYLSGTPIIRPMFMEFPDQELDAVEDQFMLGESILIAPVTEPGATQRVVIFPKGDWFDYWTDEKWSGGQARMMRAPLDRLPIYIKAGTILPMGPVIMNIPDRHYFERLDLHIYPPFEASFEFYDDDGRTESYRNGEYSVTSFNVSTSETSVDLRIGASAGYFNGQVGQRTITLIFHTVLAPLRIIVDGLENHGWQYAANTQRLTLALECSTAQPTLVNVEFGS